MPFNSFHKSLLSGALTISFCCLACGSHAQNDGDADSLRLYKKIKRAAQKYRMTRLAYEAVFVDPEPKEYPKEPVAGEEKNVNPYLLFPGKIIRSIHIEVLDPFGHSVYDTIVRKTNVLQKTGNRMHVTTRRWIIHNRLLFNENDSINPLALSETERMLRTAPFVNDARVFISPTPSRDSVDVNVIVHDKWPLTVPVLITDVSANARIRNTNLFGSSQHFEHYSGFRRPDVYETNGTYSIANIDRTYISSTIGYAWNRATTSTFLNFDRPFFSPLAKWASGLYLSHAWSRHLYNDTVAGVQRQLPVNLFGYDAWAGKSFKLSKSGSMFNQSTNILAGLRHYQHRFIERPDRDQDTARSYKSWGAVLGNVGFAVQQYYKDKFVYRFGANEDVPEGLIVQFIYGAFQREYDKPRLYNGIEVARAKHFPFGYLSGTFSYGIFYNKGVPNDITTNYQLYYFSDLLKGGRWYFRQFVHFNLVHGENKLGGETVMIRPEELYGFQNTGQYGNTKMLVNAETVAYMPYNFIGFRFAPVVMAGIGMMGDRENPLTRSQVYQGYSVGVMVRNENLLSSTFQFSAGFYPYLPDGRQNVFVYNPVTSFTLRVRGFSVSRPEFISYW
jgi:hypothetical protein